MTIKNAATIAPTVGASGLTVGAITLEAGGDAQLRLDSDSSFAFVKIVAGGAAGATLNGNLKLTLGGAYVPAVGTTFKIVDNQTAGATSAAFANLVNGYVSKWTGSDYDGSTWFSVSMSDNDVWITRQPVPEPASLGLMLVGAAAMRRRPRR